LKPEGDIQQSETGSKALSGMEEDIEPAELLMLPPKRNKQTR
jgi:hypothetical protein